MRFFILPLVLGSCLLLVSWVNRPSGILDILFKFSSNKIMKNNNESMQLGTFSVSLAVKDIQASKTFYQQLGFNQVGGDESQNWLILRNGDHTIGLFQGMFENNVMTFNPGWDAQAQNIAEFTDVRQLKQNLVDAGVKITDSNLPETGPGHISLVDPDGNAILIDQHR